MKIEVHPSTHNYLFFGMTREALDRALEPCLIHEAVKPYRTAEKFNLGGSTVLGNIIPTNIREAVNIDCESGLLTAQEVATKYRISQVTVYSYAGPNRNFRVDIRKAAKVTSAMVVRMKELKKLGRKLEEISKMLGLSVTTIKKHTKGV